MALELDPVFIGPPPGPPGAAPRAARGRKGGPPNRHPGQGTACRRFFFRNAYLEFLWVEDAEEARGPLAGPLRLWERCSWRQCGACPFGLILRPAAPGSDEVPFPTWEYRPPY